MHRILAGNAASLSVDAGPRVYGFCGGAEEDTEERAEKCSGTGDEDGETYRCRESSDQEPVKRI